MRNELQKLIITSHTKVGEEVKSAFLEKNRKAQKRDCVFMLKTALEDAESYLREAPIIPYIAAQRARWIINRARINTTDFDLITEKEYLDRCFSLIRKLTEESSEQIDNDTKKTVELAFTAQEGAISLPGVNKILREITNETPLGKRIIEVFTEKRIVKKWEPKASDPLSTVLGVIFGIIGAIVGVLVLGVIGFLIGAVLGVMIGVVVGTGDKVEEPPPDQKLDMQAEAEISFFKEDRVIKYFTEFGFSPNAVLSNPKEAKRVLDEMKGFANAFDDLVRQEKET